MNVTRIFNKLPSDSGVTFEGFEDIKLASRENVKRKLEEFISLCESTKKPTIRVILGEWGEGKTDAYKRYIRPRVEQKGHYAFFVSASTLANSYDLPVVSRVLKSTSLSAVRFLVALFYAIREENRDLNDKIPDPQAYNDATLYLDIILNNLIGKDKDRRIFVFIDEFEELLLYPDKLKEIISGIKETVNGMYSQIDEGGKYEGCLHFIIAATPDAYFKLQTAEETSLIFGGLGRRAGVIELPVIKKEEGIIFLYKLLRYAYEDSIPQPLPITNFGVFNLLYRVSLGNPGALVSLFTRLMNSARIDDKTIKVIDYNHILEFLRGERIFVYGASTPALDIETYNRLLRIIEDQKNKELGEKASKLLKLLIGELKPFSVDELEDRINHKNIKNLIAIINDNLKRRGEIEKAIIKVCPLRPDKTVYDVEDAFKSYIVEKDGKKFIQIDAYSEQWEQFKDLIIHFYYENEDIKQKIYLPCDEDSIISFFEGITKDSAYEVQRIILKKLVEDEPYYMVSEELLSQIFPTPVPRELDFIKDREKRLKLWRDVSKNLVKEYEINMPDALISLLEKSKDFSILKKYCRPKNDNLSACVAELKLAGSEIKFRSLFFPVNGDVKEVDIDEISRLRKEIKPPIHSIFLIFTGDITPKALEEIDKKGLGRDGDNVIIEVKLHPTIAKRIICLYKALNMSKSEIQENQLNVTIDKVLRYDLGIPDKIDNWLKDQENNGVFIKLRVTSTSNLREFADTLKFFVNVVDQEIDLREVYDKNQEIVKYTRFSSKKVGLIPDINFSKFREIVKDLMNNGFLERRNEEKYKVKLHPVESRILKILETEVKLSIRDLEDYFILDNPRYLQDVFLHILEYKGFIMKKDEYYYRTNKFELYKEIESLYNKFNDVSERFNQYGYIYMVKERGERLIVLSDLRSFIDDLYKNVQQIAGLNDELELQKLSLIKRLIKHFDEDLFPLIKEAKKLGDKILDESERIISNIENLLYKVKEKSELFKIYFELKDIVEYSTIMENINNVKKFSQATDEEIREIIEKFNDEDKKKFNFAIDEKEAFYFNPKVYLMNKFLDIARRNEEEIIKVIENLNEKINKTINKQETLKEKLKGMNVSEKYKMSCSILDVLRQFSETYPQLNPVKIERVKIKDLADYLESNINTFQDYIEALERYIPYIKDLYDKEKEFVNLLETSNSFAQYIFSIFDIEDYQKEAKNYMDMVDHIKSNYEKIANNVKPSTLEEVKRIIEESLRTIGKLTEELKNKKDLIYKLWEKYVKESKEFLNNIKNVIKILKRFIKDQKKMIEAEKFIDELNELIDVDFLEKLNKKLSELEKMKLEIRNILLEALKDILTIEEFLLIEIIVKKIGGRRNSWISYEDVYKIAENDLKLDPKEITKILDKLIDELKILKRGVSLA